MKNLIVPTLAFALMGPTIGLASGKKMSLDQAIDKCTERAIRFGKQPHGFDGTEAPPSMVQDRYRTCVYANAGEYPPYKVQYRETVFQSGRKSG